MYIQYKYYIQEAIVALRVVSIPWVTLAQPKKKKNQREEEKSTNTETKKEEKPFKNDCQKRFELNRTHSDRSSWEQDEQMVISPELASQTFVNRVWLKDSVGSSSWLNDKTSSKKANILYFVCSLIPREWLLYEMWNSFALGAPEYFSYAINFGIEFKLLNNNSSKASALGPEKIGLAAILIEIFKWMVRLSFSCAIQLVFYCQSFLYHVLPTEWSRCSHNGKKQPQIKLLDRSIDITTKQLWCFDVCYFRSR